MVKQHAYLTFYNNSFMVINFENKFKDTFDMFCKFLYPRTSMCYHGGKKKSHSAHKNFIWWSCLYIAFGFIFVSEHLSCGNLNQPILEKGCLSPFGWFSAQFEWFNSSFPECEKKPEVAAKHLFVNCNFIYKRHLFSQGADHTASFTRLSSEGGSRPLPDISGLNRAIKNSSVKWKNYLAPVPSTCPRTYSMGDGLSLIYGILAKEMRIGHAK